MPFKTFLFLIVSYLTGYSFLNAQPIKHETFFQVEKNVPEAIAIHVPAGYQVLKITYGNLNVDSAKDVIVVLKSPTEDTVDNIDNPVRRPLLILLGKEDGTYTLAFRNDKTVYCLICGGMMGDPFQGVAIKNGYFTIEHYGGSSWRWTAYITFKYNAVDKQFYLHRTDYSSFHASEPNKVEKKTETSKNFGKVNFLKYDAKYDQ